MVECHLTLDGTRACAHATVLDCIREPNTMVCRDPESNMGNAAGCSPVLKLYETGIPIGLGAGAYTHDMLESLKVLLPMQRHNACDPNADWGEAMGMLVRNSPAICARYFQKPRACWSRGADVIVMDYKPFPPFGAGNIDGHMLFGMMGKNCRTTIVGGKVVYKDRESVGIGEDAITAGDECYNCEWSTELTVPQSCADYVEAVPFPVRVVHHHHRAAQPQKLYQ